MNLQQLKEGWVNEPDYHATLKGTLTQQVNNDPELNEHRKWVRDRVFGMGEDAFHWAWKLIVDELPVGFKFLECGVHKSQVLSLIRILSNRTGKDAQIFGITPMNGAGTGWTEDDYQGDIKKLHDEFKLQYPVIHKGFSQDKEAVYFAVKLAPFDVVYIDGSHEYPDVVADLENFSPLVKKGGFLVMDDCCNDLNFAPMGHFTGIEPVTNAFLDYMKEQGDKWEFMFNVEHLRILRKK